MFLSGLIGVFFIVLNSDISGRFQNLKNGFAGRIEQWAPTLDKFWENWSFGFGAGIVFHAVLIIFRQGDVTKIWFQGNHISSVNFVLNSSSSIFRILNGLIG